MDKEAVVIERNIIENNYKNKEKKAKKLSDDELEQKAKGIVSKKTGVRTTTIVTYDRNPYISELAKRREKGIYQLCNNKAPFLKPNGEPYLETHHIKWLSQGESDTIKNTVALCPNCHRKIHVLNLKRDVLYLIEKVKKSGNFE